jgi:hypothetical protein
MAKFIVEGVYQVPEWWTEAVDAEDEIEAEEIALEQVRALAPAEAVDFEVYNSRMDV